MRTIDTMYEPARNARYDHAFAIVRIDKEHREESEIDQHHVTVKRVVWRMEEAEREVERLNRLAEAKSYRYYWEITRLDRPAPENRDSMEDGLEEMPRQGSPANSMAMADALFEQSMSWLQVNYRQFSFSHELDLVSLIRSRMAARIREEALELEVVADPRMLDEARGREVQLVLRDQTGDPLLAAVIRYEPDHGRADLRKQAIPIVSWSDTIHEIERARELVDSGKAGIAYAILVDEGGSFRPRPSPAGARWIDWNVTTPEGQTVSVLWSRFAATSDLVAAVPTETREAFIPT